MKLGRFLSALLASSRTSGRTASGVLGRGLHVRVSAAPERLCLYRVGTTFEGEAAEREGRVCAEQLGWTDYLLSWEERETRRYLIVTRTVAVPEPDDEPPIDRAQLIAEILAARAQQDPFWALEQVAAIRRGALERLSDDVLLAEHTMVVTLGALMKGNPS